MNITATEQVRCGNHGAERVYHANSADVRACYQGRTATPPAPPSRPAPRTRPRNADEARSEAITRLTNQTSPFFQGVMARSYPASDKQKDFLRDLADEVLVAEARSALLAKLDMLTGMEAKALISDMVVMREERRKIAATVAPVTTGNRSKLVAGIMGGRNENNFCVIDEDGKARFYRISKRGKQSRRPGTWKIQERVTDMLLPRSDALLVKVVAMVTDQGGAEAAGKRFAELMHRCYKCGASLTDTTGNPYYAQGLGPECGSK